jgi:hypothetical protein
MQVSSRTAAKLHVTNGDSVVYLFRKAGIVGTYLPWRDALHEGPVPKGLSQAELSRVRAGYLASRGYGNPIKVYREFEERDATLARAGEFEEVVLWFEHDLYDQLQLLQVLVMLDDLRLEPGRISLIASGEYLGSMTADEISALHPKRKTVTSAVFAAARNAWNAFTSEDSDALAALVTREVSGMPHLRAAVVRLMEEYPWMRDGLSRSERQALQAVAQGPGRNDELFRRAQAREEAPFLGDTMFYALLADFASGPDPLIEDEGGALVPTALGRRVLAGDADWLESHPVARWIGGVQLDGTVRFDDDSATFNSAKKAVDS